MQQAFSLSSGFRVTRRDQADVIRLRAFLILALFLAATKGTPGLPGTSQRDQGDPVQASPSPSAQPAPGPSERAEPASPDARQATPGGPVGRDQGQPGQSGTEYGRDERKP